MDWWKNAETFHASPFAIAPGQNGQFDWGTLEQGRFTFTTHCPIDKSFIEHCHQLGVRCFPYVTFYMGAYYCHFGPITSNTYNGVDFSQHPDFMELDQKQQPKPWVFSTTTPDGVGVTFSNPPTLPEVPFLVCPNYKPFQDKMVQWVEYIMQQGADGVFVDVLIKRTHCYAPHTHIYPNNQSDPDAAQNDAFALLLSRVRGVVKSYRKDGLVIGNSGDPLNVLQGAQTSPKFQQYVDADTLEGYICQGLQSAISRTQFYFNTQITWEQLGIMLQSYLAQGKQVLVIPALGDPSADPVREDAFLTYSAARLAGLTWYGPMTDPRTADLHRIRLGAPLGIETKDPASGIKYRVFERGVVAVNWQPNSAIFPAQKIAATALAADPQKFQFFYDMFACPTFNAIDAGAATGSLTVPANSGRVFLFASSTDYGLNRLTPQPVLHPPFHPPGVHPPINPPKGPPHTIS